MDFRERAVFVVSLAVGNNNVTCVLLRNRCVAFVGWAGRRHTAEQIARKLREAEIEPAKSQPTKSGVDRGTQSGFAAGGDVASYQRPGSGADAVVVEMAFLHQPLSARYSAEPCASDAREVKSFRRLLRRRTAEVVAEPRRLEVRE